ncbi:MarR family winged helix-turn-helix transcriptional regulator [Consotaella salsifontis]|uniref:Transcriptional regulator, MarR family n=1 Tax=Consotaella salsifontis TaxID=1365950 RepID=A0A1T4QJS6_9HYPH|nr:MarR family transcriptional regulator [Consotaella salsifontis]SKA03751.1 transcriptional regulator, MarR family [Consotaella salsifontis]
MSTTDDSAESGEEPAVSDTQTDEQRQRAKALAGDLHSIVGRLKRRFREESKARDLTPSQWSVLRRLELEGPATVTSLARAEGMRPQSMGATVAVLIDKGVLVGAPDPDDGRQTILSISPTFFDSLTKGRAARDMWLKGAIQARLSPAEQEDLARAIELLQRLVDT